MSKYGPSHDVYERSIHICEFCGHRGREGHADDGVKWYDRDGKYLCQRWKKCRARMMYTITKLRKQIEVLTIDAADGRVDDSSI